MKVAWCIPAYGETKALFSLSAIGLATHSCSRELEINGRPATLELRTHMVHGSSRIERARERLAELALAWSPDFLLWTDIDQTFPEDTLFRLAAHDLPFVGCNIRKRDPDRVVSSAANLCDGRRIPIEPKEDGLEQVDMLGLGVALVRAELFRRLPRPWFSVGPLGEDGWFCEQLRALGVRPAVDHKLSREVGHVAETVLHFPR